MKSLPPSQAPRAARVHFAEPAAAVLRLTDGRRVPGKLKVVSVTGGLLSVPHALDTGSNGKLMFLTAAGMVVGSAEMLSPLSLGLQPFRFVDLQHDDQSRLQIVIQASTDRNRSDHGQIESSRAW
jgi:hypothetical protein